MQKRLTVIISLLCICLLILIIKHSTTVTTIKYFPADDQAGFQEAESMLTLTKPKKEIAWSTKSISDQSMYLRQDIGLLYENGLFKGVQSKWKQDESEIVMSQQFTANHSGYLQAITFHHGEIHHDSDHITSIQQLSTNNQFLIMMDNTTLLRKQAKTIAENQIIEQLQEQTNEHLHTSWKGLISHFELNRKEYELIPLVDLIRYEESNLPNRSEEETKQIIGQLWEGLYKNYILPLMNNKKNKEAQHYMPIILLAKDNTHLLVLYELQQEKQILKQQLPASQ